MYDIQIFILLPIHLPFVYMKIRRIVAAADAYVRFINLELPVRFDIITVIKKGEESEIDHIEDAFYAPCRK